MNNPWNADKSTIHMTDEGEGSLQCAKRFLPQVCAKISSAGVEYTSMSEGQVLIAGKNDIVMFKNWTVI